MQEHVVGLWGWLETPTGIAFGHAVIFLINSLAVYIAARAHRANGVLQKRLDTYTRVLMEQIHGGHDHPVVS